MSTREVIENKISYVKKQLKKAAKYQGYSFEELQKNEELRDAVERKLYVIAQAAIDLADAVAAYKELRKPITMRESFDILGETDILPKEFIDRFIKIVGFRNALAHDYEDLKLEVIYDVLQNKLKEVDEFLGYLKKALGI